MVKNRLIHHFRGQHTKTHGFKILFPSLLRTGTFSSICRIAWDRELSAFAPVEPVLLWIRGEEVRKPRMGHCSKPRPNELDGDPDSKGRELSDSP